jgi:hypothetical protein
MARSKRRGQEPGARDKQAAGRVAEAKAKVSRCRQLKKPGCWPFTPPLCLASPLHGNIDSAAAETFFPPPWFAGADVTRA